MTSSPISTPDPTARLEVRDGAVRGTLLLISGVLEFLRGLSALFDNTLYVNTPKYILAFDTTAWGWIHLVWGVVLVVVGGLILAERPIGRILALVPGLDRDGAQLRLVAALPVLVDRAARPERPHHLGAVHRRVRRALTDLVVHAPALSGP